METPVDATGAPYAGGQLFFYESGTNTKLNTYSDSTLQTANPNPVVLDSAGRFPNAIFLKNAAYKVVLAPADDTDPPTSPIWTQDPVYTSDYSTAAKFYSLSGSPNGALAGTAGSATVLADSAWDFTNQILYICTATGSSSTAVWTAVNAATAANVVPAPQGRLTLSTGTPVMTGDVSAATTVYYTPYIGDDVPIYNGTTFLPQSIVSELQLTLTSSHVANNIYDFFIFSNSGVVTLGTGPTWSAGTAGSITAGSCARGTGVGGAALSRVQGLLTNAVSMSIRYGDGTTTATVDANQATYVGSMYVDGTNGQVSYLPSYGQSRKCGIWNAYNRVPIVLKAGDGTANWNYSSTTPRASNGSSANNITVFCGLAEEAIKLEIDQRTSCTDNGTGNSGARIGIGWNSTSSFSGQVGVSAFQGASSPIIATPTGRYKQVPSLGINVVTSLEAGLGGAPTNTFYGTEANMLLSAEWRG